MMKLETPIGEFTTDSYKIPAGDTLAVLSCNHFVLF